MSDAFLADTVDNTKL